jgi:uncharacterized integral membrane protein
MLFLIVLTVMAVVVAVGALQNGQLVTFSFFVWQFQSPLAVIILAAAGGGIAIGVLVGWARALRRWHRQPARVAAPVASVPERFPASRAAGRRTERL